MSAMRRGGRAAGWDQPLFERLEERLFLTGNVGVAVSGQALTLTGDDLHNEIVIDAFGLQANQFRVTGVSNTTLNGGAAPIIVDNIRDIKARLGAGNYVLTFTLAILLGGLTVEGGAGTNTLTLFGFGVGKNVTLKGGEHFDRLTVDTGTVGGNVTLAGGDGATQVRVQNNAVINGNLSVRGGDGYDDVAITNNSAVNKNVTVNAAVGGSKFVLANSVIQGKASIRGDAGADEVQVLSGQVTRGMDIRTGSGADTCVLQSVNIGSLNASLGEDDNSVTMTGGMIGGRASIRGGGGKDKLEVLNGAVVIGLRFDAGGGDNEFQLANSSIIAGDFRYRGGDGMDRVMLSSSSTILGNVQADLGSGGLQMFTALTNITITGNLRIRSGLDQDMFAFYGTTVAGDLRVDSGAGPDTLSADDSVFQGRVSANMGAGYDAVWFDFQAGNPLVTTFEGPVSIQMGADDDTVRLGVAGNASRRVWFKDRVAIDGGKGLNDDISWMLTGNATFDLPPVFKGFETQT